VDLTVHYNSRTLLDLIVHKLGSDTRRNIAVDILFANPRNKPSASLHESLGLATVDTPVGIALKVDERRQTSMPGIYAAGDLATTFLPSVTLASSQGAIAGIFAQQSMLV
jgi:thioredoxin reductase